ncbi:MAG: hypothetical protein WCT11_00615 [Candidatus Magasanikbacteria bacterium]|jgi:hypothetical protein
MTDKNLDNLNDPVEKANTESGRHTPEISVGKEREKSPTEKSGEKQSTLEKYAKKLIPVKVKKVARPIPQVQDEMMVKIEKILETGLADEYAKLSPIGKQEFKIKGEETTAKIRELLRSTHIKVKKIFYLIIEWLKILPGINNFFLEQEAKIKTDLIVNLHKKEKKDNTNKLL